MDTVNAEAINRTEGEHKDYSQVTTGSTELSWVTRSNLCFFLSTPQVNSKRKTRDEEGALACFLLYKEHNRIMVCMDEEAYL